MDDRLIDLLRRAEDLKKELDSLRPLDKEREAIVMQKLRLDWNYHSNHLEGNSLTFGETKALILFGITAQGKPLKDHFEITGHDEAIKSIEDVIHKKLPLTEHFIRELHTLLLKEPYEVDAITPDGQPTKKTIKVGQYKSTPNHVKTKTGEIFRFATPEETPSQMHDLMEWYRKKSGEKDINPIILAAEFHYKFIRIHPFDDGNGRMARILMNFILMQYGYPPVIVKTGEKEKYIAALQQADAGIFEPFFEFIITNEIRSLEIMVKGARGESVEEPDDLDKELALLEQRLKGQNPKLEKVNTLNFFDNNVKPFAEKLIFSCYKFDRFYANIEVYISLTLRKYSQKVKGNVKKYSIKFDYLTTVDIQVLLMKISNDIMLDFDEVEAIHINTSFADFLYGGNKNLNYSKTWIFRMNQLHFDLSFANTTIIKGRPYSFPLKSNEIDSYLKVFITQLKTLIDSAA